MRIRIFQKSWIIAILTLLLFACGGGGSSGNDSDNENDTIPDPVISENAIIVEDEDTINALDETSINSNNLVLIGTENELSDASVGDVIVLGETAKTPNGLLKRIIAVTVENGNTVVTTDQAALTDIIENAIVRQSGTILPIAVPSAINQEIRILRSMKGVSLATSKDVSGAAADGPDFVVSIESEIVDGLTLTGSIGFSIDYNFDLDIENSTLQYLKFELIPTQTSTLTLSSEAELASLSEEITLATYQLPSIKFFIGVVPVVIVPQIDIVAGVEGNVSVDLTTGASYEASATVGVEYNNEDWNPVAQQSTSFNYTPPSISANAQVMAYVGPTLEFLLYGLTGPEVSFQGYSLLDANATEMPWWSLYGGIRAGAAVSIEILDDTIATASIPDIIDYRVLLNQAETDSDVDPVFVGTYNFETPQGNAEEYLHLFSNENFIFEVSPWPGVCGNDCEQNSVLYISGTYQILNNTLTIFPQSARDDSDNIVVDSEIDECWAFSPYYQAVSFPNITYQNGIYFTAQGEIQYSPGKSQDCGDGEPDTIPAGLFLPKISNDPSAYLIQ